MIFSLIASRPLTNLAENQLESLLIEGGLLEIYVDQVKLLTKLVNSSRRSNSLPDVCLKYYFFLKRLAFIIIIIRNQKLLVYKQKKINQQQYVNENPMKFFRKQV